MAELHVINDLRGLTYEEEATFGLDPAGTKTALRAFNISFEPGKTFHDVAYQKTEACRGPDARIAGGESGKLKFSMYLRAHPGSTCDALSLIEHMGATLTNTGSKIAGKITGGGATSITMLDADATDIAVGQAIYYVPTSGTASMRFVTREASATGTTTLTVNQSWATNPANGAGTLYAVDTITPTLGDPAKYFTFYFYQGAESGSDNIKWIVSGCTGKWSLGSVSAGGLPVLNFEMDCDNWSYDAGGVTTANEALTVARPILGDSFLIGNANVDVAAVEFDPGMTYIPVEAHSGSNGRSGFLFTGCAPKISATPLHDNAWLDKWSGVTKTDCQFESKYSSTSAWSIWIHGGYVDDCAEEESNGLMRRKINMVGRDPGKSATELTNIPMWALAVTK